MPRDNEPSDRPSASTEAHKIATQPAFPPVDFDEGPSGTILTAARDILLREYYSGLTMDRLALALGMSKKTLYVHFSSKDAMVAAIIAATGVSIRRQVTAILDGPGAFPEKLEALLRVVAEHVGVMSPDFLQDLNRFAPQLFDEIQAIKERNIPTVFGRVMRLGVEQGMIRADIDVTYLAEYWLQVAKGVHDTAMLARTGLTPREALEKALDLFFFGVFTPAARKKVGRQLPGASRS
ncbi:Bacterial regulatory proteins, tetR family [Caballeronia arationis]|jgi:AcrR family transcriptional regulator|uniref:Transcriptional regulator, TetR family n=1 Tax=Caballeronia arationis TaxID=1777142 RepID=A0A7Z7N772_9BURK|nr:TetR/AcrR family transcriptional regulator [Caballeronia arationis]SAK64095.1 Bacterial regulatory proteins, tetR family [Caballeronia arationis]SOE88693.1 transcriptional regulator, TetR family [Caballeronia arationis]